MTARSTVVTSSELAAAGTFSASDLLDGDSRLGCRFCGFSPADVVDARRPNPRAELLEPDGVDERDPLHRSVYRCRDQAACENRQRLNG